MPTAATLMRTSPAPGSRTGTSSTRSTSGPPNSWNRTALTPTLLAERLQLEAAARLDVLGRHPAPQRRRQREDHVGDFLRRAEPAQRRVLDDLRRGGRIVGDVRVGLARGETRTDRV